MTSSTLVHNDYEEIRDNVGDALSIIGSEALGCVALLGYWVRLEP